MSDTGKDNGGCAFILLVVAVFCLMTYRDDRRRLEKAEEKIEKLQERRSK